MEKGDARVVQAVRERRLGLSQYASGKQKVLVKLMHKKSRRG